MAYTIGIDVSTTATKALLCDEHGHVTAVAATEYGFDAPHPLWSEQDPALWWNGTVESVRNLLAQSGVDTGDILGVGLTGRTVRWGDDRGPTGHRLRRGHVRSLQPRVGTLLPRDEDRVRDR